jgi:hypothetical protein
MPTVAFLVCWKRNRNHRGREIVFSEKKAAEIMEEKKELGFKSQFKKLHRHDPMLLHFLEYGVIPPS